MAYALRYYKEFTHADGKVIRLEIHKKDSTTAAVEIGAVVQGLSLQIQGQQGDIDTPIVKTSLSMTFVDAGDIENGQKNGFWEEFYTPDSVLWKVLVKAKKAGETAFTTIWGGYVTPDSFSESLTYRGSVNIIARDNIGHMQDFPFDAEGDEDGMISLYDLVNTAWAKIESPMSLMWDGGHWMQCEGVNGYNTLMNVSAFEDMSWYEAVEKALYSYGGVMRYIGGNEVLVTTLRYMPTFGRNIDRLPRIEPTFITGATRELVPAVKRVEESVKYDISQEIAEQVGPSDYTGDVETYTLVGNSVDKDGIAYPINNRTSGQGWCNPDGSLFFNPQYYTFAYDKDADAKYMWLAANNYQLSSSISTRYAEYSKRVLADNLIFNISFGSPYAFRADGSLIQFNNITACTFVIMAEQGGVTEYLNGEFEWVTEPTKFEIDASAGFSIPINLESYDGMVLLRVQIHQVLTTTDRYAGQRFVPVYSAGLSCNKSLLETNTVNTNYQEGNNVVLSRDPEIGPAYNTVALPAFIKNGIFRREGSRILPAYKWGWSGSTPQQMAVYNHLQLLAYYAKPNNLISGTIVNADVTDIACIYEWHHADHILVSGNLNLLNGHIEGAMLREYARYEYLWGDVEGAGFPETEQASTTNVEGGASAGGSSSTYTNNMTVNIGTGGGGGGASYLGDLQDVDVTGVVAQSVLYYNGTSWVDMSFPALINPLLNPYLKSVDAEATYATKEALNGVEAAVFDNTGNIKKNFDAIGVLESNKADKATTLAGYGITDAYTQTVIDEKIGTVSKAVSDLDTKYIPVKTWYDELASLIVKEGNNVRIKTNIIIDGDQSATGEGGGAVSGITGIKLNGTTYKDENNDGIIDLGTITGGLTSVSWSDVQGRPTKVSEFFNDSGFITSAALLGYATQSWVEGKGYITGITLTGDDYISVNGYQLSLAIDAQGGLTNTGQGLGIYQIPSAKIVTDALGYTPANNASLANYLPLSGGKIQTSSAIVPLTISAYGMGNRCELGFNNGNTFLGALGMNGVSTPIFKDASDNIYTLIHSGNIGSYNAGSATKLQTARTIWGQSFDGTGNVSGALSGVSQINFSTTKSFYLNSQGHFIPNDKTSTDYWWGVTRNDGNYAISVPAETGVFRARFGAEMAFGGGNVLIGTSTDNGYKLDVAGSGEVLNVNNPTGGNVGIRFSRSTNTSWSIKVAGGNLYIDENNSGTTRAIFYESSQGGSLALTGKLTAGDTVIDGSLGVTSAVTMSSTLTVSGLTTINNNLVVAGDISA